MHAFAQILLSALLVASTVAVNPLLERRACNADNCARLISGTTGPATKIPAAQRTADCKSYLYVTATPSTVTLTKTATVTPAPVTVATSTSYVVTSTFVVVSTQTYPTSTVSTSISTSYTTTVVVTVTPAPNKLKRAMTSSGVVYNSGTVPAYASSSCGSGATLSSRYSSACSCLGIQSSTTTVATPTTTVSTTVTAVASSVTFTTTITTFTSTTTVTTAPTPLTTVTTTVTTATTTTTTATGPTQTSCTADQNSACGDGCICEIDTGSGQAVCADTYYCAGPNPTLTCNTDADCTARGTGAKYCIYDDYGICDQGAKYCVSGNTCPHNTPFKRELEDVFQQAGSAVVKEKRVRLIGL